MNTYSAIHVDYLNPTRTFETILITNNHKERLLYVYNYEGYFFRIFTSISSFMNFIVNGIECDIYFESDSELDDYLENVLI